MLAARAICRRGSCFARPALLAFCAALAVSGHALSQDSASETAAAVAVARGCHAREGGACGFEFVATRQRIEGSRTLGLILNEQGRAAEAERLTGGSDGTRGKFVERHRVTSEEWEVEAQCCYWGGVDRLFAADIDTEPTDVGGLHMKRLYRPSFTLEYATGPVPSYPMGLVTTPAGDWRNSAAPCAEYIGLSLPRLGRPSEFIDGLLASGAAVSTQTTTHEGHDAVVLTIRSVPTKGAYHLFVLGFVRLDGYAPFSMQCSSVIAEPSGAEYLVRSSAEWGDYVQVAGGPWIPCRHTETDFSTDSAGVLRLD